MLTLQAEIFDFFDDLDALLGSNENFLLGLWIRDARALSTNPELQDFYEFNARNQVTLWGNGFSLGTDRLNGFAFFFSCFLLPPPFQFKTLLLSCLVLLFITVSLSLSLYIPRSYVLPSPSLLVARYIQYVYITTLVRLRL